LDLGSEGVDNGESFVVFDRDSYAKGVW
jgi:hypothetical protein